MGGVLQRNVAKIRNSIKRIGKPYHIYKYILPIANTGRGVRSEKISHLVFYNRLVYEIIINIYNALV